MTVRLITRRLAALIVAPLLVVGLAACATAVPEAMPTPTPTPTSTVEAPPEAKPGSRIPLSCVELAALPSEFTSVSVTETDLFQFAVAGFASCVLGAQIEGADASLRLVILPDLKDTPVGWFDAAGAPAEATIGFAGSRSGVLCAVDVGGSQTSRCESFADAQQFSVSLDLNVDGVVSQAGAITALASYLSALVPALDAVGDPLPAWDAGPGVLTYPNDCENDMAAVDGPIIDVLPFESARAEFPYSDDGAYIYVVANRRTGGIGCEWRSGIASLRLTVVAGASWVIDEGGFTPLGSEISLAGADRAWLEAQTGSSQVIVTFVVDRSLAFVSYEADSGGDPAVVDAVLAVVAAVIATGPRI